MDIFRGICGTIGIMHLNTKDLTNKRFNKLIVINQVNQRKHGCIQWRCICDCGKETIVTSNALLMGDTKSCGCLKSTKKTIDLKGKKFNRLLVLESADTRTRKHRVEALWKCQCDCGKEIIIPRGNLISGNTKSCGCLKIDQLIERVKKPDGEASFTRLYTDYKNSKHIRKKNLEFSLSKEVFRNLVIGNCHYCGRAPFQIRNHKGSNGSFTHNGIDRLDSNIGYVVDNVVTCCKHCNHAKWNFLKQNS